MELKTSSFIIATALMSSVALSSTGSAATTHQIFEIYDLSNLGGFNALASVYFTVTAGDSIDLTENFANDEALQSNSGSQSNFSPRFSASVDPMNPLGSLFNFGISNLSITLFDFVATGGVTESDFVASDLEGRSFRLGPYFFDFTSLGQTVEISGFNLHYDIDTPLQSNFAR